jgi:hypothetical protein
MGEGLSLGLVKQSWLSEESTQTCCFAAFAQAAPTSPCLLVLKKVDCAMVALTCVCVLMDGMQ